MRDMVKIAATTLLILIALALREATYEAGETALIQASFEINLPDLSSCEADKEVDV